MDILIIEDEPKIASDLSRILQQIDPSNRIVDKLDTVESAVSYLSSQRQPDLIFMDIHLADGLSFSIFNKVNVPSPVVFLTAYDEYALQAFKVNSIDYILKPFDRKSIENALTKFRSIAEHYSKNSALNQTVLEVLKSLNNPSTSTILVPSGDKYIPVATREVAYFHLEHGSTFIKTLTGKAYSTTLTLDDVEKKVDTRNFYRVNRQYIVNFDAIQEVGQFFNRKLTVKLRISVKESIIVSKARSGAFLDWMKSH